ncbi:type I toxin-antitoxin system Fst family toxin [Listeria rustica]|uniref:Type I toxin-antitoxin system Fst family toxin n=1 Tax=Listeria rustica TaxID=2713503 RepID=A0A7W1T4Y8_9LIST|nr:type I toxin-antitoxin system Fst family toxin [Listeria rustica]MBA3925482.1 type I toxin-antitoxin system Fst family toxin [Listeria rustica]
MIIIFSSVIAPIVVGCAIVYFKHMLESRSDKK